MSVTDVASKAETKPAHEIKRQEIDEVTVRFAGDSGDGVQLTGGQFTQATALAGNDLATFPDFPAEIRAPVGTTFGVSAFQIHFGARRIYTPGDAPDVLVVFNPAALKVNLPDLVKGGLVILDSVPSINGISTKQGLSKIHVKTERWTAIAFWKSTSRRKPTMRWMALALRIKKRAGLRTFGRSALSTGCMAATVQQRLIGSTQSSAPSGRKSLRPMLPH